MKVGLKDERQARANHIPNPVIIAGDNAKSVIAGRNVIIKCCMLRVRVHPIGLPAFELIFEPAFFGRSIAQSGVMKFQSLPGPAPVSMFRRPNPKARQRIAVCRPPSAATTTGGGFSFLGNCSFGSVTARPLVVANQSRPSLLLLAEGLATPTHTWLESSRRRLCRKWKWRLWEIFPAVKSSNLLLLTRWTPRRVASQRFSKSSSSDFKYALRYKIVTIHRRATRQAAKPQGRADPLNCCALAS